MIVPKGEKRREKGGRKRVSEEIIAKNLPTYSFNK